MLKILKYMNRRDWLFVVCSLVFIVCGVGLDLRLPDYMREITSDPGYGDGDRHAESIKISADRDFAEDQPTAS